MTEKSSLPTETSTCPYPGCTVEVVDGTGPACSVEHQAWFNEAVNDFNAGIPFASTTEQNTPAPVIGGTLNC